jgi:Mce-associated membrane protein
MIRTIRRSRIGDANDTHSDSVDEAPTPDSAEDNAEPESNAADSAEASRSVGDEQEGPPQDSEPRAVEPQAKSAPARLQRAVVYGLLPGLAMLIAGGAGYLKWLDTSARETQSARIESVQAATESTIKILSYSPDSVDHDLDTARDRLTGKFRDAYTQLIHDVVIPGSKEKKISSVATVPAASSVSASPSRAVVMVFVNQTIMVGNDPPSSTSSTVKVTMDKHDNRWLISDFTPI